MIGLHYSRRDVLRSAIGLTGLTVPTLLRARAQSAESRELTEGEVKGTKPLAKQAKSCIIIYLWGGLSHYESWDPKVDAPKDIRGEFGTIPTKTPGVRFCEYLPLMAEHQDKLAIVRSVHHNDGGHGSALYLNITGHAGAKGKAGDRENWPSIAAMISKFKENGEAGTPAAIRMPYSMYDNGALIQGQIGGWLGPNYDPILIPTPAGEPFGGTSRTSGKELSLKLNLAQDRVLARRNLLEKLDKENRLAVGYDSLDRFQRMAADMLLKSSLSDAYDLDQEDPRIRTMYGNHMGGQGLLLARRLIEVGVPVVQICAGAGDLAGGSGDNWDTHRDHFPKMKRRLLPVFDKSVSALLTDMDQRGMLDETLVVFLTEFGRTPKVNGNGGRDHYPAVYSLAMAGGPVRGGAVYGSSNVTGTKPKVGACTPADFHATVYKALGINPHAELHDQLDRPFVICEGQPLPIF